MVKNTIYSNIAVAFILLFSLVSCATPVISADTDFYQRPEEIEIEEVKPKTEQQLREELRIVFTSQLGVRELTGNNDGTDVEKYLKATNLGKGYAWCAAFVKWCFDQVGVKTKITAWSPTAHNKNNIVYFKNEFRKDVQVGDVITLYYQSKGRIGHTGFFLEQQNESMITTVEGNSNGMGSSEGDGVYLLFRPLKTIYSITSHF